MGRVRTKQIKTVGKKLYDLYRGEFKPDFEHNKKMINRYVEVRSKRLRNFMAGYMTHLVREGIKEESMNKRILDEDLMENAI